MHLYVVVATNASVPTSPHPTRPRLLSNPPRCRFPLKRVEVIKGGGTQQAKDAVQQQLGARKDVSFCPPNHRHQGPVVVDSSSSLPPQGFASTPAPTTRATKNSTKSSTGNNNSNSNPAKNGDDHKVVKSSLLRFYQQDRDVGGDGAAAAAAAAAKTAFASASLSSQNLNAFGVAAIASTSPAPVPTATPAAAAGGAEVNSLVSATAGGGGRNGGGGVPTGGGAAASARNNQESYRPQTCPAVNSAEGSSSAAAGARCSTTGRGLRRRRRGKGGEFHGEDVRRLLLRAMVGYDWVDEFNSKDVRVRGAFTEQDVVVLEVRGSEGVCG